MRRALPLLSASTLWVMGLVCAPRASAGELPLRVEGLGEQRALLLKTTGPELKHTLRIHSTQPRTPQTVCLLAESLVHAQGATVAFTRPAEKTCLPLGAEPASFELLAPLDGVGSYASRLHLSLQSAASEELLVPLTVERLAARPPAFESKPATLAQLLSLKSGAVSIPLVRTDAGSAGEGLLRVQVSLARKGTGGSLGELPVTLDAPTFDPTSQSTVRVSGVPGPGEYQGKLWLQTADKQIVAHPFTVLAKAPAWIAFVCIFLGSLLALLLRWLVGKVSPQLLVTRRLAVVQAALTSQSDGPAWLRPIRSRLVGELVHLQDQLRAGLANDAAVAAIEEKLRLISQLQTAHVRSEQCGGAVTWPEGSKLLAAAAESLEGDTSERAQLDAAQAALTEFHKQFAEGMRAGLARQAAALRELLERIPTDEGAASKLAQRSEVERLLKDAQIRIDAGQLVLAFRILSRASLRIASYGVDKLLSDPEPAGTSDHEHGEWLALIELAKSLQLKLRAAEANPEGSLGQDEAAEFSDLYLRQQKLVQRITARQRPPTPGGGVMSAAAESRPAELEAAPELEASPIAGLARLSGVAPVPALPTLSIIDRWRAWTDRGIALAAMLVSCTTGILVLWVDDPTWGDLKSMITAFLWGLGLHQVAGIALGSITEIQGKLLAQR